MHTREDVDSGAPETEQESLLTFPAYTIDWNEEARGPADMGHRGVVVPSARQLYVKEQIMDVVVYTTPT
ncbi:MAG TPA: hypothetical protein VJP78_10575 [Thermoleophilia bacterium]|nr:hypothetical protein [Thermoleophilia bacterium]